MSLGSDETKSGMSAKEFSALAHDRYNEYIKLADSKASLLLSGHLAYLALVGNFLRNTWTGSSIIFKSLSGLTILSILIAAYFAASAVYPREPETGQGLLLWKSIAGKKKEKYKSDIISKSESELLDELIAENYALAKVNVKKYSRVRKALWLTGIVVLLSLASVGVLYL